MAGVAIRSRAIQQAARREVCTLQIPGVCNHDLETTVLAHLPDESKGMGRKPDDHCAVFACSSCHDVLDGRRNLRTQDWTQQRDWYMRRALTRTWRRLIDRGIIQIGGKG